MSLVVVPTSQGHRRGETPKRWHAAMERAQRSSVEVYEVGISRFVVTSATHAHRAYETDGVRCTCAAAQAGDDVCLHRAAVRAHLAAQPEPPVPGSCAYDALAERLRWAENDQKRAWANLDRCNAKIAQNGRLSEGEYQSLLRAQERAQDAYERIVAAKAELAKVTAQHGKVAA